MTRASGPPLRYLLIATHVPASGAGGGMVRYAVELATALSRRPDVELHLLGSPAAVDFLTGIVPRERVHTVPGLPMAVRSLVERYGPSSPGEFDVVHGVKHLLPRRSSGALRVLTVHDMLPFDRPWDFGSFKRLLLRLPYLGSVRDADVITCVSAAARARLLDYAPGAANRAVVVPLAASGRLAQQEPEVVGDLAGRRFALVVGDASARKNLALAVETWPQVRDRVPDAVLAVVGPPAWAGENRGTGWEDLVSSGAVVHLGHVRDAELAWCYRSAAAVLCPSLLEGFGLPIVEAMAFGAPVVTTDDPAMCEIAGTGTTHVAAWSRDRWVHAVSAAMLAGRGAATPVAEARTWDDVAAETIAAVRDAGHGGGPGAPALPMRIGVSPFDAPLRLRHVVGPDAAWSRASIEDLAAEHGSQGWQVDVGDGLPGTLDGIDVVVLHGLAAGRLRSRIRGTVSTVVVAGAHRPRGPVAWSREVRMAEWTHAVVVDAATAPWWARSVPVPLTVAAAPPIADEAAAIFARSRAWGRSGRDVPPLPVPGQPVTR